ALKTILTVGRVSSIRSAAARANAGASMDSAAAPNNATFKRLISILLPKKRPCVQRLNEHVRQKAARSRGEKKPSFDGVCLFSCRFARAGDPSPTSDLALGGRDVKKKTGATVIKRETADAAGEFSCSRSRRAGTPRLSSTLSSLRA